MSKPHHAGNEFARYILSEAFKPDNDALVDLIEEYEGILAGRIKPVPIMEYDAAMTEGRRDLVPDPVQYYSKMFSLMFGVMFSWHMAKQHENVDKALDVVWDELEALSTMHREQYTSIKQMIEDFYWSRKLLKGP